MTLKEKAYDTIKRNILICQYAPGQSLNEDMLCSDLKISRTPVRDALSRLNQENLIKIIPKKGIRITSIKFSDLNDLYDARLFMEPQLVLNFGKNASKEKLLTFLRDISALNLENVNTLDYTEKDMEFHGYIFSLANNPYFTNFYDNLATMDYRISVLGGVAPIERRNKSKEEHIEILKLLLNGDFEGASETLKQHIQAARRSKYDLLMTDSKFASYFTIQRSDCKV